MNTTTQEMLRHHPNYADAFRQASNGGTPSCGIHRVLPLGKQMIDTTYLGNIIQGLASAREKKEEFGPIFQEHSTISELSGLCDRHGFIRFKDSEPSEQYLIRNEIGLELLLEEQYSRINLEEISLVSFGDREKTNEKPKRLIPFQQFQPVDDVDFVVNAAAERLGWVEGYNSFIQEHGLNHPRLVAGQSPIDFERGLLGIQYGMVFFDPAGVFTFAGMRDCYRSGFDNVHSGIAGYKLGFMVGAFNKYGMVIEPGAIPSGPTDYGVFQDGKNAVPMKLPDGDTTVVNAEGVKSFDASKEQIYRLGLEFWLQDNGLATQVSVDDIRHPEALYAFTVKFAGDNIGDYDRRHPSAERQARRTGQKAYNLAARVKRHSAQITGA